MSEATAGRQNELGVQKVSDEEINRAIQKYTKNPETTIYVNAVDISVMEKQAIQGNDDSTGTGDSSSGAKKTSEYVEAGTPGKKDLDSVQNGMIIKARSQNNKKRNNGKKDLEKKSEGKGRDEQ